MIKCQASLGMMFCMFTMLSFHVWWMIFISAVVLAISIKLGYKKEGWDGPETNKKISDYPENIDGNKNDRIVIDTDDNEEKLKL